MSFGKRSLDDLAHIAHITVKTEELTPTLTPELSEGLDDESKRKLACTGCRQQKSRCDAKERQPLPCLRCTKKGIPCQLQPGFRRTEKRARLALIEREYAELKRSVRPPVGEVPPPPPPVHMPEPLPEQDAEVALTDELLECTEKVLEDVVLAPAEIGGLFREFVAHYHPVLPVVDVGKGPERLFRLCPALFWVVMFVALRRHLRGLMARLQPHIKRILAEITILPIARYNPTEDEPLMNACSVYLVQAFILYTLWPPVTLSLSADSSWNTIGVALFQAIRIGLHLRPVLDHEHARTWLLCNVVSQDIATAFGFPAFVDLDAQTRCPLPRATRQILEVAHFQSQCASTLPVPLRGAAGALALSLALLRVLGRQLDELEAQHQAQAHARLHELVARTHLLTYHFLDAAQPLFERLKGLVQLFHAAQAVVAHVQHCEAQAPFVKYLPLSHVLHLWQALSLIARLAHLTLRDVVDAEAARELYSTAVLLVKRALVLKHDMAYRASGIMRSTWLFFAAVVPVHPPALALQTTLRKTASVFFDSLAMLRDKVGLTKLSLTTDVRDDSQDSDGDGDTRRRRLSDDGEALARRIIQTIPLDPRPIQAHSSVSKTASPLTLASQTSRDQPPPGPLLGLQPGPHPMASPPRAARPQILNPVPGTATPHIPQAAPPRLPVETHPPVAPPQIDPAPTPGAIYDAMGHVPDTVSTVDLDSMEKPGTWWRGDIANPEAPAEPDQTFFANDSLWKDVDSLMNDFGFHV